jgi:hypothetical protein
MVFTKRNNVSQPLMMLNISSLDVVAQEENANLDFAGKFVRPTSTSFTIPINDLFFKHKQCQMDKDEDEARGSY